MLTFVILTEGYMPPYLALANPDTILYYATGKLASFITKPTETKRS